MYTYTQNSQIYCFHFANCCTRTHLFWLEPSSFFSGYKFCQCKNLWNPSLPPMDPLQQCREVYVYSCLYVENSLGSLNMLKKKKGQKERFLCPFKNLMLPVRTLEWCRTSLNDNETNSCKYKKFGLIIFSKNLSCQHFFSILFLH